MNKTKVITTLLSLALLAATACAPKKPKAAEDREKWLTSLNDSIAAYQKQTEAVSASLAQTREEVGQLIGDFEYVNHSREVEGYHIYKGWQTRYPMTQTALVARITESEGFELIATLTGGVFNEIAVSSGGETLQSKVVPHDQALNYRAGNLNTVCFTGSRADSIGQLITAHDEDAITVTYLNGKRTGSLTLPADQRKMIAATWRLYSTQKAAHNDEKELSRLSGKINVCRRMLEANDSVK